MTSSDIVGGGAKKILYTLSTINRIGLRNSTKALTSHNTCKACGLGMGGQRGGMVNELGEFPSVCNKSVQAQSTDIQAPIPEEIFRKHRVSEFRELSGYQIEHLGRLGFPIYKAKGAQYFQPIPWAEAIKKIAETMAKTSAARSFFYASGRSSNEAGFLFQLLARVYGTNNVNNCSYYCHQATGVALGNSIGSGTATVELEDLRGADLVFLIGANPASNHPRLIHKLKDLRERGGQVVVINPAKEAGLMRFAVPKSPKSLIFGGTEIASHYLQPRIGSDIFLFKGLAKALIEKNAIDHQFIANHTTGFETFLKDIEATDWSTIVSECGIDQQSITRIADVYHTSNHSIFAWGMGMTHHSNGVENIEYIANLALLRGMLGKRYAGLLPLRGHSNVQGIGTIGVKPVLAQDVFERIEQCFNIKLPRAAGMDTLTCLEAAEQGDIDFALIMGGNLYGASPDHQWAQRALDKIACKVFLTTTLNHGHVHGIDNSEALILPVKARDEEHQATTQESMFNYLRLSEGGINRLAEARSETDILADIAQRLLPEVGLDFSQFKQHKTTREHIAAIVPGLEKLKDIDQSKQEFHITGRILHQPNFNTDDGRAQFITHANVIKPACKNFPFTLMTVRSEGQFNTIIYEESDSYRGTHNRWTLLMNAEDIKTLQLDENGRVDVRSAYGEMLSMCVVAFDLPRNNAMAYFPEANILIGRERDARSHTPAFKSVAVAITASQPQAHGK